MNKKNVGVLALQGGYQAHVNVLQSLDVTAALIVRAADLNNVDALIIPGGESTTMLKLLHQDDFVAEIQRFKLQKKPILGTCAGAILLASSVSPAQFSFGFIDIRIERNAYGRQIDSAINNVQWVPQQKNISATFIRAPAIKNIAENVEVLATLDDRPVCVVQDNIIAATYHPELSNDRLLHQYFLNLIAVA